MSEFDSEEFEWQEPEDYGVSIPPNSKEPPLVRLALDVLIESEDAVLRDWVDKVLPHLLDYFSLTPAKGMSLEAAQQLATNIKPEKQEKVIKKLVEHKDQSLAVHLLNAAVGGWTLIKLANLEEIDQRLYLAGVTLHDLNKIVLKQLGSVRMDGKGWEQYRQGFETWGEALGLWEFIPRDYWQDVAFLAQNAEDGRGQNLTLANFPDLQINPARLIDLSEFVNFADVVASIAHHPQDLEQNHHVKSVIRRRLRGDFILRHHRTNENRGLLTQAIHNAVLEKVKVVGWKPFLFFPDGVTYFAPKNSAEPDFSTLAESVRQSILQTVAKGLGGLISRQPKGIISHSPDMLEVATVDIAAKTLISQTFTLLGDKRTPVTATRREKIQKDYPNLADLDWEYPSNLQVDRLAEGVRGLVGVLEAYYATSQERASQALLNALDLDDCIDALQRIPSAGGVPHGWYYIAGHYMRRQQSGLNDIELENVMLSAVEKVIEDWGKPTTQESFAFLDFYISTVLNLSQSQEAPNFVGELHRYHMNKASRKRDPMCAVCNSAFDVREEYSSYTNKRVTAPKNDSKRGICSVCQVEQLLRDHSMGRGLSASDEVVYLHFYPDYFFTPETALIMGRAYESFAQSVFSDLDKELSKHNYDPKLIPRADVFRVKVDPNDNQKRRLDKVEYPRGQMHGYYLLGVPYLGEKKKLTDTKAWNMPALLSLIAPVAFGIKVVASRSTTPPYNSGADFKETVVLDGVHSYWQHGMRETSFRLDKLRTAIPAAFALYSITAKAYQDNKKHPVWNALNTVAQSLDTSPLYVFHYADRIQENRKKEKRKTNDLSVSVALDLLLYHQLLVDYYGGDDLMQMIGKLVDSYTYFYRAKGFAAYARLRPLNVAAKVVLESQPYTSKEDLQLMIEGYLLSLVDDVIDKKAEGFVPPEARKDKTRLVAEFAKYFLEEVFQNYCRGERSLLRQNINLIRKASEAYYIKNYSKKSEE
ncbi:type I-D CRISPR-associated protein Cas10d/Csc3 [Pseudanabaena galeata UHCC 0370]|uniref:Type I-D CRISPR-associated protein Cas10d/Csc3 n=1 Tax=Pseudanabaena galeata UHCC 0370 TaxID=3110310 RepID=A0ABU5TNX7_9CYAN|nr:type I-D CRISPR-associated protein Cas10d/Csc3 [Pseudanabaena galeata]MEA5480052.1 type I-D CRISPR-associated protein Cas10d/Csc3 [Pseudanabaena galeata UHCC 0370]